MQPSGGGLHQRVPFRTYSAQDKSVEQPCSDTPVCNRPCGKVRKSPVSKAAHGRITASRQARSAWSCWSCPCMVSIWPGQLGAALHQAG